MYKLLSGTCFGHRRKAQRPNVYQLDKQQPSITTSRQSVTKPVSRPVTAKTAKTTATAKTQSTEPTHLLDLPYEIHLVINQYLGSDTCEFVPAPYGYDDATRQKYLEYYGVRAARDPKSAEATDLLNLSSTCSYYRQVLAPVVFRSLVLKNTATNVASMQAIASGSHWMHVQEITFVSASETNRESDEKSRSEMSAQLRQLLSQLPPNLRILTLDLFGVNQENHLHPDGFLSTTPNFHTTINTWLQAISSHKIVDGSQFEFNFYNLTPLSDAIIQNEHFNSFLGKVTSMHIGFGAYSLNEYWAQKLAFFSQLTLKTIPWILDQAHNVTSMELHSDCEDAMGYFNNHYAGHFPISGPIMKRTQMPRLKQISCRYGFLDRDFMEFVAAHHATLESLTLIDCYAGRIPWSDFFDAITDFGFNSLRTVNVEFRKPNVEGLLQINNPSPFGVLYGQAEENGTRWITAHSSDVLKTQSREAVEITDPRRRKKFLPYATNNIWHGRLQHEPISGVVQFFQGRDNEAWNRLVDLLDRNEANVSGH